MTAASFGVPVDSSLWAFALPVPVGLALAPALTLWGLCRLWSDAPADPFGSAAGLGRPVRAGGGGGAAVRFVAFRRKPR